MRNQKPLCGISSSIFQPTENFEYEPGMLVPAFLRETEVTAIAIQGSQTCFQTLSLVSSVSGPHLARNAHARLGGSRANSECGELRRFPQIICVYIRTMDTCTEESHNRSELSLCEISSVKKKHLSLHRCLRSR